MAIGGLISNRNFDSFIGSEDEREFNYEDDSEKGPARWGEIRQEWSLCNKGSMQSSIDLLDDRVEVVSDLGRLQGSCRAMVLYVMDTKFNAKFGNTDPSSLVTMTSPWRRGCGPCGGRHGRLAIEVKIVPNSAQPNTNL
ncbi:PREDICTED: alpha carbonic anhydrase [Prunus dulcis]|uniref:PREDICTED: alpha carbonic anhydrase n=1 Tax=Prunus dulcis TaxID=3755 RepID=A0A5E4FA59_PRUDU|nr:PREDICTED: alpha carbonic anhydrase [Prunus dulcis]